MTIFKYHYLGTSDASIVFGDLGSSKCITSSINFPKYILKS